MREDGSMDSRLASRERSCSVLFTVRRGDGFNNVITIKPLKVKGPRSPSQRRDDRVRIVNAAPPSAAADGLQRGPEPGVVGEIGIGRKLGMGLAFVENGRSVIRSEVVALAVADQIDGSLQAVAVDHDPDPVAVAEFADRSSGKRFLS